LTDLKLPTVTGAAFSKARYKIQSDYFKDLNQLIITDYEQNSPKKLWKGYRLLAGDGSTLSLPCCKAITTYFGKHEGTASCLAQVFILYDVLSDIVVDARISKEQVGEKTHLISSLDSLVNRNEIILLDRGFGHFNTCQLLNKQARKFCIRMSTSNTLFASRMMQLDTEDSIVDWHPSEAEISTCKKHKLSTTPLKVRVTKITLKSGEVELLVSNLFDQQEITIADMKELYNYRWNVEEGYKKLKSKLKIEYFGCKKPEGVLQEFYAHIFLMNFIAIVTAVAQDSINEKTKHRKQQYKCNWQNAYRFVRETIIELLAVKNIKKILDKLLQQIESSVIAIRKNRTFKRKTRGTKPKPRYSQMYK